METGGKLQLVILLSISLQIITPCSCTSIAFQQEEINNWELLIGGNEEEFLYDFCRYNASKKLKRCHNDPENTADIRKICSCTVIYTANEEEDSVYFSVNCNNETLDGMKGGCPQKLTIVYERGNPVTNAESSSSLIWIWLFSLSLLINMVFGVALFMLRHHLSIIVQGGKGGVELSENQDKSLDK
ncbi:Hypothetical predicted protein [Cloeon dipterum]|uniref:Uncharacterized protein n=1 Tax=Cloeon dipterum TaxID=197152 RepID=A0A8S1D2P6_9INSE|nr:Hypothetical predicted protein [Cloeon dipterum]